jgi:hypothetical protein
MKTSRILTLLMAIAWCGVVIAADTGPVKVFILAGQSNMEGKASNGLLNYQATNAATKDLFAHLRKDDQWIVRDDVFIKFLGRKGPLTVGYGSPGATGVELDCRCLPTMLGWLNAAVCALPPITPAPKLEAMASKALSSPHK